MCCYDIKILFYVKISFYNWRKTQIKEKELDPYQIFINARDYGTNLDVSWYLTYRPSLFMAILSLIPFVNLMSKIKMAAFSRSDIPREARIPFYLYVDEFQNFATGSFIEMLSEARKYALSLIMAHQNLAQLPKDLQGFSLTNCRIQVYFRISRRDAEILAKEAFETTGTEVKGVRLSPETFDYDYFSYFEEWEIHFQELQTLAQRACYVKHKIEGGIFPIQTVDVEPPYLVFGFDKEEYMVPFNDCVFGRRFLLERGEEEAAKKAKKIEEVSGTKAPSAIEENMIKQEQKNKNFRRDYCFDDPY